MFSKEQLQQLQRDPLGMAQKAGYQIPQELAGNPQAMVMHLIQTGQVGGPMMQQLAPLLRRVNGR